MAKNKQQIKFEADISGFKSAIKDASSFITSLNKELKLNQEQLKGSKNNIELLQQKVKTLKEEYEKQTEIVKNSEAAYERAVELFGENSQEAKKWADNIVDAKTKQEKIKNALNETNKELENQSNRLISLGNKWQQSGEKIEKVGEKISKVGDKLTVLGAGVGIATVGILKQATDYESAFAGVIKTVDATEEELKELNDGILEMSTRLPTTAKDIAAVSETAGQLGIKVDDILDFTEVMVNLGESTNLSATDAATALAKFANITKMSNKDYSKLGSVIVALGNNFATTESDIVSMATRLAATGELTGLTEPQIMALSTAMSSVGIEAEAGGSAMSRLLKKIQVSTETGGRSLEQFAKVAGMSSADFKKAFQKDAVKALGSFITGLKDTKRNGKSAIAILEEMGIKDVRLSNTILSLSSASDVLNDSIDTANNAWDENTALNKEVEKRYSTTESQLKILKNEVSKLAIEFGRELTPALIDIVKDLKPLLSKVADGVKWFSQLDGETKETALKVIGLTTALGPLTKMFGNVVTTGGHVVTAIGKISTKIGTVVSSTSTIGSAASLLGPLVVAVGSVKIGYDALEGSMKSVISLFDKVSKEKYGDFIDLNNREIESYKALYEEKQKNLDVGISEITYYQSLKDELDKLVDENGRVKEGYEQRATYITGKLKDAFGIEINLTKSTREQYEKYTEAVQNSINSQKLDSIMKNLKEKYDIAVTSLAEAKEKMDEAVAKYYRALSDKTTSKETLEALKTVKDKRVEVYNQMLDDEAEYVYASNLVEQKGLGALEEITNRVTYNIVSGSNAASSEFSRAMGEVEQRLATYNERYKDKENEAYKVQIESTEKQLAELGKRFAASISTIEEMSPEEINAWKDLATYSLNAYATVLNDLDDETIYKIQEATGRVVSDEELENSFRALGRKSIDGFKENNFKKTGEDAGKAVNDGVNQNNFRQTGVNAGKEVKDGLASQKSSIASTGKSLGNTFSSNLMSVISNLQLSNVLKTYGANGSHADGLAYVPYNGYVARLHEGERVLSKAENADYVRNNIVNRANNNNVNINFYAQQISESDLVMISNFVNREWGMNH